MNLDKEIKILKSELKKLSDPKRAIGEKKYLKSSLKHYGVTVPKINSIAKQWANNHSSQPISEVAKLSAKLWQSGWHEEKSIAIELLTLRSKELNQKQLPLIKEMIHQAKTWAHLDNIAVLIVGALIDNDSSTLKLLPQWAKSDNFWVRRTAVLAQVLQFRKGKGNFKLFTQIVIPMFEEGKHWSKEERFFIRKSIGWALRELTPTKPQLVFNFIKKYREKMSGLTFREGTRKLPDKMQQQLK